jgi:LysM repeat protein
MRNACGRIAAIALAFPLVSLSVAASSEHTVQPGDTLSEIAQRYGVPLETLRQANDIENPDLIRAGERVLIPAVAEGESRTLHYHVVQEGDTLGHLALRFDSSVEELKALNGLDSDLIVTGSDLLLPGRPPADPNAASGEPTAEPLGAERPVNPALEDLIQELAGAEGLEPGLVKAIAWLESGWDQGARSSAGAIGVMQLMPATVAWLEQEVYGHQLNEDVSVYDNVKAGVRYLELLRRDTDSLEMALVAYYQGPGVTRQGIIYDETRRYVDAVVATREKFWP